MAMEMILPAIWARRLYVTWSGSTRYSLIKSSKASTLSPGT